MTVAEIGVIAAVVLLVLWPPSWRSSKPGTEALPVPPRTPPDTVDYEARIRALEAELNSVARDPSEEDHADVA